MTKYVIFHPVRSAGLRIEDSARVGSIYMNKVLLPKQSFPRRRRQRAGGWHSALSARWPAGGRAWPDGPPPPAWRGVAAAAVAARGGKACSTSAAASRSLRVALCVAAPRGPPPRPPPPPPAAAAAAPPPAPSSAEARTRTTKRDRHLSSR